MVQQILLASGQSLKLGRNKPSGQAPQPQLSKYLNKPALPTMPATAATVATSTASPSVSPTVTMVPASMLQSSAPAPRPALVGGGIASTAQTFGSVHYETNAAASLSKVYCNDYLGCCLVSAFGHLLGAMTAAVGNTPTVFTNDQISAFYTAACGGQPGDNGLDELTALTLWQSKGFPLGGDKVIGWLEVDGHDPVAYRTALDLFGNLIMCAILPREWATKHYAMGQVGPSPSFVWDVESDDDTLGGHAVVATGYEPDGLIISTWGTTGRITDAAIKKYFVPEAFGRIYTVLDQQWVDRAMQKAPSGLSWQNLLGDFHVSQTATAAPRNNVSA